MYIFFIQIASLITVFCSDYIFVDRLETINDAESYCYQQYGTTLASIHSQYQNDQVLNLCRPDESDLIAACGIGLNDQNNRDILVWSDQTLYNWSNWDTSEQNQSRGNVRCAMIAKAWMNKFGTWFGIPCNQNKDNRVRFVCNAANTPNSTLNPTLNPTISVSNPPSYGPNSLTKYPTKSASINLTNSLTKYPTKDPSKWPSYFPTILYSESSNSPSHFPSVNRYIVTSSTDFQIMAECDANMYNIGKCDEQLSENDEHVHIDASYYHHNLLLVHNTNVQCFVYHIFEKWFDGLEHIEYFNLCNLSNIVSDIDIYDSYITLQIIVANTETYNVITKLKFHSMKREFEKTFMEAFGVNVYVTMILDYSHSVKRSISEETIKSNESYDTFTISLVLIGVFFIGILFLICLIVYLFRASQKSIKNALNDNVLLTKETDTTQNIELLNVEILQNQIRLITEETKKHSLSKLNVPNVATKIRTKSIEEQVNDAMNDEEIHAEPTETPFTNPECNDVNIVEMEGKTQK